MPTKLPNCEVINVLENKLRVRNDIYFNHIAKLEDFRQRVSQEVRQINELFPEYTPHDEDYHLSRLFHVADMILGREHLELMNSSELFILALALYGHDWGMAVSQTEKEFIILGRNDVFTNSTDRKYLDSDRNRFGKFLLKYKMDIKNIKSVEEVGVEIWREYVRNTHALRSGEKVRRFFEPLDGGVAEAVARVCIGHWQSIEEIDDYKQYPQDFSVLRETINLKALAIYLRLIDLLDLAQDRTPYIIWKYVDPRDPYSKMEWEKHRALQPITCPKSQVGRIIRVDGSTDDHNVYAALEDLRILCEAQFRDCNKVLARMNDSRHTLDIYSIDWRVAARGFKPISIQFEFERIKMFEILSSEIYKNDYHVFLRELLQNSIDAIRTRRELLKQKKVGIDGVGAINVTVKSDENGDTLIIWKDDGIGMDEYVIRNYLSVAGKSYYRSSEFEHEGLNIDPISHFGVGILSCFMVSDRLEIETYKDPYLQPNCEPLKVIIPNVQKQFRIEVISSAEAQVGTTFKILVNKNKMNSKDNKEIQRLKVTDYLSYIAGFVEFPIIINEGDKKTVIIHPKCNISTIRQQYNIADDYEIAKLELKYPIEEIFLPQDISSALNLLKEINYDIHDDLGTDYEGIVSYLVPRSEKCIDITDSSHRWPSNDINLFECGSSNKIGNLRWHENWTSYHDFSDNKKDYKKKRPYKVYRDGILLTNAEIPQLFSMNHSLTRKRTSMLTTLPIPLIIVNLPKEALPDIDISRTEIIGSDKHWENSIWQAYLKYISEVKLQNILSLDINDRLISACSLSVYGQISLEELWEFSDKNRWPIPVLSKGKIEIKEWEEFSTKIIYLTPFSMAKEIYNLYKKWLLKEESCLQGWNSEDSIILFDNSFYNSGSIINSMMGSPIIPLLQSHVFSGIRFLEAPFEKLPPIIQKIYVPLYQKDLNINDIIDKYEIINSKLDPEHLKLIIAEINELLEQSPEFAKFPEPFNDYFAYGNSLLNINHQITQRLICWFVITYKIKKHNLLDAVKLGLLIDYFKELPFFMKWQEVEEEFSLTAINESIKNINLILFEARLFDEKDIIDITLDDFIPGTIYPDKNKVSFKIFDEDEDNLKGKANKLFGNNIIRAKVRKPSKAKKAYL